MLRAPTTDEFDRPRPLAGPAVFSRMKSGYRYSRFSDQPFNLSGEVIERPDCLIVNGPGGSAGISVEAGEEIGVVIGAHDWSGVIELRFENGPAESVDLYSWYSWQRVLILPPRSRAGAWTLKVTGRNPASRGEQLCLVGLLRKKR
jgi:hypothetical protein